MNSKQKLFFGLLASSVSIAALTGCAPKPTVMAPPMNTQINAAPVTQAPPVAGAAGMPGEAAPNAASAGVYQWQDVPPNQEVPITRGVFDQGGYQLYAASGETIVVPFANQNMYVMKFGKSTNGAMYFKNENGQAPLLYVPSGGYLTNAAAQNARWYPFSDNFNYSRPVYMGIAPTWNAYMGMGWYPGMTYYGGYWGYNPWSPGIAFVAMPGLYFNIGGRPYYGWNSYSNYYRYNSAGRVGWSRGSSFNYGNVGRRTAGTGSFGRAAGSSGSFGRGGTSAGSFGRSGASGTGSFGRSTASSGTSSFGRSSGTAGSFGRGASGGTSSFGRPSGSAGSFGSGSSFGTARNSPGGTSSFGSSGSTTGRSSFGSGGSSFGSSNTGRSSFGSGGSSGFSGGSSSFGRSSSGGSSFGSSSGRSSFGGGGGRSFGGGRRR